MHSPESSPPALALSGLSLRLKKARDEHAKLLRQAASKRGEIARRSEEMETLARAAGPEIEAIFAEMPKLARDLFATFEKLVTDPKRPKAQRAEIRVLVGELRASGIFDVLGETDLGEGEGEIGVGERVGPGDPFSPKGARGRAAAEEPSFVASAETAPMGRDHGTMRSLFRQLAETLHPDKVQDEAEKHARTEVMKRITAAYRAGDYASLVDIQQTYGISTASALTDPEVELRALTATNATLRRQVRELDKKLREARAHGPDALERDLEEARRSLQELRTMHDFTRRFAEGKMSFREFRMGPPELELLDEEEAAFEDMEAALLQMFAEMQARPRGKTRTRARKR